MERDARPHEQIFKVLAHPFRIRLLRLLSPDGACICHLVAATNRPQPYVSQHMRVLREAGLVVDERRGRHVHYRISRPQLVEAFQQVELAAGQSTQLEPLSGREGMVEDVEAGRGWSRAGRQRLRGLDWAPRWLASRCTGCGICVVSCEQGVFAFDYARSRPVLREERVCSLGCTTCATLCPEDAIQFPEREELLDLMRQRGLLSWARRELLTHRSQYEAAA